MKKENAYNLISSLIYIAFGVVLVISPTIIGETVCYLLAGAAIAMGIVEVVAYITTSVETRVIANTNGLAQGVLLVLLGIFILVKQELVISLIPFILGFMITTKGIFSIQNAINLKRIGYGNFKANIIAAVIIAIFGIIMMLNPFTTAKILFIMIGLGLIISGICDIVFSILISKELKKQKDAVEI